MTTDTWEERMAAKTRSRRKAEEEIDIQISREEFAEERERFVSDYASKLTLEKAIEEDSWPLVGCACMGGPMCCQVRYLARRRVIGDK